MRMNIYRVVGKVKYLSKCRCDYCKGHEETDKLDCEVEGVDEDMAKSMALYLYHKVNLSYDEKVLGWDEDDYRYHPPKIEFIKEVPEEIMMLRAGQKPLWSLLQSA